MSEEPDLDHSGPLAKKAMPPLRTRAERPSVVRIRKGMVIAAGVASAGLCSGALAWAFIIQPDLRAQAREEKAEAIADNRGQVRPSPQVSEGPATYSDAHFLKSHPLATASSEQASLLGTSAVRPTPDGRTVAMHRAVDEARGSGLFFKAPPDRPVASTAPESKARADYETAEFRGVGKVAQRLIEPLSPYELKAGSVIPALLLTGVDSARAGPVTASVSENIYDTVTGLYLIIPQGSRLVGRHEGASRHGDKRVFLVWDRLILPNGKSLILSHEPGVDAQGVVGVKGAVDRRVLPLISATLFAGAITTLGQIARDEGDEGSHGWLGDAGDAAAIEAAQVGGRLVDRELDVRPSIRLQPGARVRVLVTNDLILELYQA